MTVPEMNAQQTKKWTVVGLGTLLAAGAVGCATPDRIADPEGAPLSPRIVALVAENRRYPEWRNFPRQGTPPPDAVAVSVEVAALNTASAKTAADIAATAPEIAASIDNNTALAAAMLHDSEQLQARALLLQEEIMARLSERTNKLLYLLSVLTAVLLPATVIAGFFGMNLHGIPFTDSHVGFWEAALLAAIGAAGVVLFVHRLGSRD